MKGTLLLFSSLLLLGSCSTAKDTTGINDPLLDKKLELEEIVIQADVEANRGRPVEVDLVFVLDKTVVPTLSGFTADGWFTVRDTGLGDWEQETVIESLTINPGEQRRIGPADLPAEAGEAVAIVIFANYRNPGLHRAGAVDARRLIIHLQKATLSLSGS